MGTWVLMFSPESLPTPPAGPLISWLILQFALSFLSFLPPGLLALSWYESCLSQFPTGAGYLPPWLFIIVCLGQFSFLLSRHWFTILSPGLTHGLLGSGPHGGRCQVAPGGDGRCFNQELDTIPGTGLFPSSLRQSNPSPDNSVSKFQPIHFSPSLLPLFGLNPTTSHVGYCDGTCTHLPAASWPPSLFRTLSICVLFPEGLPRPDLNQVPSLKSRHLFSLVPQVLQSVTRYGHWSDFICSVSVSISGNELQGQKIRLVWFPTHQCSAWHMMSAQPVIAKWKTEQMRYHRDLEKVAVTVRQSRKASW